VPWISTQVSYLLTTNFIIIFSSKSMINHCIRETILSDASSWLQLMNMINIVKIIHVSTLILQFEVLKNIKIAHVQKRICRRFHWSNKFQPNPSHPVGYPVKTFDWIFNHLYLVGFKLTANFHSFSYVTNIFITHNYSENGRIRQPLRGFRSFWTYFGHSPVVYK